MKTTLRTDITIQQLCDGSANSQREGKIEFWHLVSSLLYTLPPDDCHLAPKRCMA